MMLDLWRDIVMRVVLERFSPVMLKVLSDERVQTLLAQALNLQADMRQNIEAQVKLVARTLELVTRDELSSVRAVVKNLEAEVANLRSALERERAAREKAEAAVAAAAVADKPIEAPLPPASEDPVPKPKPAPKRTKKTA